jgi:hypothetical protein
MLGCPQVQPLCCSISQPILIRGIIFLCNNIQINNICGAWVNTIGQWYCDDTDSIALTTSFAIHPVTSVNTSAPVTSRDS